MKGMRGMTDVTPAALRRWTTRGAAAFVDAVSEGLAGRVSTSGFVIPAVRGRGFSRSMLTALEDSARELGIRRLVLETGPRQLEALALYRRAGFVAIPRFGEYTHSELSLCMGKDLHEETQILAGAQGRPALSRD